MIVRFDYVETWEAALRLAALGGEATTDREEKRVWRAT